MLFYEAGKKILLPKPQHPFGASLFNIFFGEKRKLELTLKLAGEFINQVLWELGKK